MVICCVYVSKCVTKVVEICEVLTCQAIANFATSRPENPMISVAILCSFFSQSIPSGMGIILWRRHHEVRGGEITYCIGKKNDNRLYNKISNKLSVIEVLMASKAITTIALHGELCWLHAWFSEVMAWCKRICYFQQDCK